MEKSISVSELLDLNESIAGELFCGVTYPWEVLGGIHDFILRLGEKLPEDVFMRKGKDIWIARNASIAPSACLNGPLIIDCEAEIRHCAYIRGNVIIGRGAVVGNSTELKNAVLFNKVQVPHFNYVGDSIFGFRAHLGAGAIISNVKGDKSLVTVKGEGFSLETGLKKMGAILADEVEVGCNSVLNPGTVVGRNSRIYPVSTVRGIVPCNSIWKGTGNVVENMGN